MLLLATVLGGLAVGTASKADAGIFYRRFAPVRTAARVALPPYPVARRVAYGPVYRPYVRPYARPVYWGAPVVYGPGVTVAVGF
jgi:hypothetical protein